MTNTNPRSFVCVRFSIEYLGEIALNSFLKQNIYKGISIDITMELIRQLIGKREIQEVRFPRLDTVLMVENFIKEHDGEFKKKQLWLAMPKGIMYQTFSIIIDYLLVSGKISVDAEGKIGWIFYPEEAEKRLKKAHLFWKG